MLRDQRARLSGTACVLVGVAVVLVFGSSCGGRSSNAAAWVSCPPPPDSAADVRRFRVKGGETCGHARRVLGYTDFGHEGECSPCHYLGYTCRQLPGGLKRNSSGGSYYTYQDDLCVSGQRRASWRIVFH